MIDETKVEKALEYGLGQVCPSPDLLDRIQGRAESARPSWWTRLRLGPKLEFVAVCMVLIVLVGLAAYRNLYPVLSPAPGTPAPDTPAQGTPAPGTPAPDTPAPGTPTPGGGQEPGPAPRVTYSGTGSNEVLHVIYTLAPTEQGDFLLEATITNLSRSRVLFLPQCDGRLVGVEGRSARAPCEVFPNPTLEPGVTRSVEERFSADEVGTAFAISVTYLSDQGQGQTLRIPFTNDPSAAVQALVESFGLRLKKVSLSSSPNALAKSIQEQYGGLITPELLAEWQQDPQQAPGRRTSSPWPDRIQIIRSDKTAEGTYAVQGEIIEVSSTGPAASRPINLVVEQRGDKWLISAVTLGEYVQTEP